LKRILLGLSAVMVILVLVACDSSEINSDEEINVESELVDEAEVIELANEIDELVSSDFVGSWIFDLDSSYRLILEADGSGEWIGHHGDIQWEFINGELRIHTSLMIERWNPVIDGNTLTMSSLQVNGLEFTYIRQ